jgi:outer membrane receptor protein involved in Fe transport
MTLLLIYVMAATLTGTVLDETTGNPVDGAAVNVPARAELVLTDADGRFLLEVPPRAYQVIVVADGYEDQRYLEVEVVEPETDVVFRLTPATGHAPTDSTIVYQQFGEVSVTASRTASRVSETPRDIRILEREAIDALQPRGVPEALNESPEVLVQKTNLGGGAPIVRGMSGNRVLLMVDGVRLNNSTYRLGLNQYLNTIDPGLVDRIEVVPGAGSALYGSDALGGVVEVFTVAPSPDLTPIHYRGRITAAEGSQSHSLRLSRWWGSGGALVSGTYRDLADLRGGGDIGIQKPTGFTDFSGAIRVQQEVRERQTLSVGYQVTEQNDVPRTDRVVAGRNELWLYDPQRRDLLRATYDVRSTSDWFQSARVIASWHHQREGRKTIATGVPDTMEVELDDVDTYGVVVEARSLLAGARTLLVYGAETYYDVVDSEGEIRNLDTGSIAPTLGKFPDDGTLISSGAFLQAQRTWTERWSSIGALRFSVFRLEGTPPGDDTFGKVSLDNEVVTASLQTRYALGEDDYAFVGLSQGFRAPNLEDALSLGLSNKGWDVPNPDLGPEETVNLEVGAKVGGYLDPDEWMSSGPRKAFRLDVTGFVTRVQDIIERTPTTYLGADSLDGEPVFRNENAGTARILGVTSSGWLRFHPHWTLRNAVAYTHGMNTDRDEPLTRIPPLRGTVNLRRDLGQGWVEAVMVWSTKQDRLSSDDRLDTRIPEGGTPGYAVGGLRAGWDLPKGLTVTVYAENLADEAYRVHGSGIDMPGRNLTLGVEWNGFAP